MTQATEISPLFGVGNDSFSFTLQDLGGDSIDEITFEPNIPGLSRIGLSAMGYGISYSFRADVKELDKTKGNSNFFDFQIGYHNQKWGVDLAIQDYEGFYITNSSRVGTTTEPYYVFPDLHFKHYGLMGRWAMDNQGFTISQLMTQSEQIKKSAGSYFLIGGIRHHTLESENTFIPTPYQSYNLDMTDLRKAAAHSLNLGVGAGKFWVSSNQFFIGGVFDLVGTLGLYKYELTQNRSENTSYSTLSFNIKGGFGYSGENFRTGLSFSNEVTTLKGLNHSLIKPSAIQVLLYIRTAF